VDVEVTQQSSRRIEHGRRIVVATGNDNVPAPRSAQADQKIEIQLASVVRWVSRVEKITGDEQYVHRLLPDGIQQPIKGQAVLGNSLLIEQFMAEVPV